MKRHDLKRMFSSKTFTSQLIASFEKALITTGDESESTSNLQVSRKGLSDASFTPQAYILAKQRVHEIETQKAMMVLLSRHNSWKAGGPH